MCQEWFAKFCAGHLSLDNAPWSDRPVEVDSNQIETLIENKQHPIMWETVNILKIIQINKVIGENRKCVFYLTEKN